MKRKSQLLNNAEAIIKQTEMGIELSKEELYGFALDSLPRTLPVSAEETGILQSVLTIGGNDYEVVYHRNTQTQRWFVYKLESK